MDFSFNNKLISTSGPLRPSGRNLPIDGRTRVDTYSDIKDIPNPYAGMKITVLADETNNGEMTEYIVKTLKANALGQPNALIDEVIRYIDFLGVATSGGISDKSISVDKLSEEVRDAIYSRLVSSMQFHNKYVNSSNGSISNSDGTIKSTEKIKYNNTTKIKFSGDLSNKFYKISYYNENGEFINSTDYFPCNDFYIYKGEECVITVKSDPSEEINPSEFMSMEVLCEKKDQDIISPQKIVSKYNILDGITVHEHMNISDGKGLNNYSIEGILVNSNFAYVYDPIQVRNEGGLIYDELYLSKTNGDGARQLIEYDINGCYIKTQYYDKTEIDKLLTLDLNTFFIVVIGYYNTQGVSDYKLHVGKRKLEWLDVSENAVEKIEATSKGLYCENVTPNGTNTDLLDPYKYPLYPAWGHEYLYSWYEKIFNDENVVICVDGDSTTEEAGSIWTSVNGRRVDMVRKIMCTIGKYPSEKITINKNGYGSRTTGTWVGAYFNSDKPTDATNFPNGILDKTMAQNPDLLIFGFGINDASTNLFPNTTIEHRLNQSKEWLEEGLKRIRGSEPVNGRPAYNKPATELAIILCTPIQAENGLGRGRDIWQKYQREMIMELARKYNCAFYDVTARHWDHAFSGQWSQNNTTTERSYDKIHPMPACNADFMSGIQDLLFPICLWKWE